MYLSGEYKIEVAVTSDDIDHDELLNEIRETSGIFISNSRAWSNREPKGFTLCVQGRAVPTVYVNIIEKIDGTLNAMQDISKLVSTLSRGAFFRGEHPKGVRIVCIKSDDNAPPWPADL